MTIQPLPCSHDYQYFRYIATIAFSAHSVIGTVVGWAAERTQHVRNVHGLVYSTALVWVAATSELLGVPHMQSSVNNHTILKQDIPSLLLSVHSIVGSGVHKGLFWLASFRPLLPPLQHQVLAHLTSLYDRTKTEQTCGLGTWRLGACQSLFLCSPLATGTVGSLEGRGSKGSLEGRELGTCGTQGTIKAGVSGKVLRWVVGV